MLKSADSKGRPRFVNAEFQAKRKHETDLRRMYKKRVGKEGENPIELANMLERAARLQKERMEMRNEHLSDHFAEEE